MVEISLECAIVGQAGSFDVTIDNGKKVSVLKKAIKADNEDITEPTRNLQLFLAKKEKGKWLHATELAAVTLDEAGAVPGMLDEHGNRQNFVWMDPSLFVRNDKFFGTEFEPGEGEVHVLVVVPKGAGGDQVPQSILSHNALPRINEDDVRVWHNVAEEVREQSRKQAEGFRQLKRSIEKGGNPATPSQSDSQLGESHLNVLLADGCVSSAEEAVGEDAFWSVEVQDAANIITREDDFDAFITPYFDNVLNRHDVVFVNSERYNWLPQSPWGNSETDLKPDGFVTHRGMYRKEPEPNDDVRRVGTSFRFGKATKALFDCLVLFESKITKHLNGAPSGQVVRYIQHLFPKGPRSAVLFNRKMFWLINSFNGVVVRVITATWVMEGSKALLRNFITKNLSPWVTRLTAACSALNVEVVEGDAFLGRGAFGRVFKVKRAGQDGDVDVLALKIVETTWVGRLFQEGDALVRAEGTKLTIKPVVRPREISGGAAMLLSPVGEPVSYPTTSQEARDFFDMLWKLHDAGVVHGDPRVPNVIVKDGQRLWIDLVESRDATPLQKRNDAKILTQSILHGFFEDSLDRELEALIDNYGARPTKTELDLLADKVGEKFAAS